MTASIQDVLEHYQDLHKKYGDLDVRTLHWSDDESQYLRFLILCQIGSLEGCKVLDAGCGFGDFYKHLKERFQKIEYTGLDLNPNFIKICEEKYPEANFQLANLLDPLTESYDYIFASGTFGYAINDYRNQYFDCIRNLFVNANRGVAINLLNARYHDPDPLYATFEPIDVHLFCMELTDRFIIRQDYMEHDMTIYLLK